MEILSFKWLYLTSFFQIWNTVWRMHLEITCVKNWSPHVATNRLKFCLIIYFHQCIPFVLTIMEQELFKALLKEYEIVIWLIYSSQAFRKISMRFALMCMEIMWFKTVFLCFQKVLLTFFMKLFFTILSKLQLINTAAVFCKDAWKTELKSKRQSFVRK